MSVWDKFVSQAEGKRVLIFGLGSQGGGVQTANTLAKAGALVRVTDQQNSAKLATSIQQLDPRVEGFYGEHRDQDTDWAEIIVKNPAVSFDHPQIRRALEQGKTVTTETNWALQLTRDQTIGITGTRGKTTTTHLIHTILHTAGLNALLCGNVPQRPTIAFLPQVKPETLLVVEISSFHLEAMDRQNLSPKYAVVTNVYPDHLNRYNSIEAYAQVKASIFSHQKVGDHAFYSTGHDFVDILRHSVQPGVTRHELSLEQIKSNDFDTLLPGQHNRENIALANLVAKTIGISEKLIRQAIFQFPGVPFRLELVAEKDGVKYINDSTSTTPVALEKALDSINEPFILIAGGTTKNLPIPTSLLEKLGTRPMGVVWLRGSGTDQIINQMKQRDATCSNLTEAIDQARGLAKKTGAKTILFSPGFTSFELFRNEFDRGEKFNQAI